MDVTTQQAAELLGLTSRSITRYITESRLKARCHGLKVFVINLDELRNFALANNLVFDENVAHQLAQQ